MCLALPAQVVSISDDGETATVSLEGIKKKISLALVEDISIKDFVLVHVGYALNIISPQEAEKTLALMAEAGVVAGEQGGSDNEVR